jgi:23S rRNA (adenine2030-N6)-methyltransferase
MLSYRHAFHAGNFADVLKHLILIEIIDYLKQKDKPICYIDTHAGAGGYSLKNGYALQNREFDGGIGALWQRQDLPVATAQYVSTIRAYNNRELVFYPGSPLLAQALLRPQDRLFLYELHTTDYAFLASTFKKDKRVKTLQSNGLQESINVLPPRERRGLIFIDPSYEIRSDYRQVITTLTAMYNRFANGVYALWYPLGPSLPGRSVEKALKTSGIKNIDLFEVDGLTTFGMQGCGLIVINPPWTLANRMAAELPWLTKILGKGQGECRIEKIASE